MNKTKKKIILAAIELFNELGVSNVRNQDIAKASDISLSNFNYHYNTKQDLVYAVCDYMIVILQERVYGNKILTSSGGEGLAIMRAYFEFEEEFRFFYLDTYNILKSFPNLKEIFHTRINEAIQIIKNLNFLAVGKGAMIPEPKDMPGLYNQLAEQIWVNNHFWFSQMHIRGKSEDLVIKGMEFNFAILYPYLTEKGCLLYTSPSPRDATLSRMPSSA